jgi:hypothetical protein
MKQYYVIKNNKYYVCRNEELSDDIRDAYEFDNEQHAIEYANRNFIYYFTFTIEKVYQITK